MTTQTAVAREPELRALNFSLWVAQGFLALVFGVDGAIRYWYPLSELQERLPWIDVRTEWWVRLTGAALMLVALSLVLPPLLRVGERLVPAVACFMTIAMVVTAASHITRGMPVLLAVDVVYALLCGLVTWGRARALPHDSPA
jgi:hypothetical protein